MTFTIALLSASSFHGNRAARALTYEQYRDDLPIAQLDFISLDLVNVYDAEAACNKSK